MRLVGIGSRGILAQRASRKALMLGLALALAIDLTVGIWAVISRRAAIDEWKEITLSLSKTVAEEVRQAVVASELILKSISDKVLEADLKNSEQVRDFFHNANTFELLRNRASVVPQVDVATIVDRDGAVVNFTRSFPPPPINLADRDYVRALEADPTLAKFLSMPVRNKGTGTWTFYLARPIVASAGRAAGYLLTGMHCAFFENLFRQATFSKDMAISLFRSDGILIARYPARENLMGVSFAQQPVFSELVSKNRIDEAFVTVAPRLANDFSSGEWRIVAPTLVNGYPLLINVTTNMHLVTRRWLTSAVWIGAIALLLNIVILMVSLQMATLVQTQVRAVAEIREQRQRADRASSRLLKMSRLSSLQEMSSAIAHELNQPLAATANYLAIAEISMRDAPAAGQDRQREAIELAKQQVHRAGDIIRHLRSFIDRGKGEEVEADIGGIIDAAVSLSLIREQHREIGLTLDIDKESPLVRVDVLQVQQVVLNLLRNAVEALEQSPRKQLRIVARKSANDFAEVSIIDSGPGLSEEIRDRLFQPFNTSREKGMGVGLSICRTIIESHGGTISAKPAEGGGTVFTFLLPAAAPLFDRDFQAS